jgi:Rha family phage regulatory protein
MSLIAFIPNDAVIEAHGHICTTSMKIAEAFGKQHKDVLRKLQTLDCSNNFTERNFTLCHKNNELQNGKPQPFYQITKDGFMFLVMGFTGKKAAAIKEAYIELFNAMAQRLLQLTNQTANTAIHQPVYSCCQREHYQPHNYQPNRQSLLPEYFDSGWISARFERCPLEMFWIWHIRVQVQPTNNGKYIATISFGIGNKGQRSPRFTREHPNGFNLPDLQFTCRHIDDLWDNIYAKLPQFNATLDINQHRLT